MLRIGIPLILTLALGALGCSGPTVSTDYDHHANFGAYRTYALSPTMRRIAGVTDTPDDRRMQAALRKGLESRGLKPATEGKPDLLISYGLATVIKPEPPSEPGGPRYGQTQWYGGVYSQVPRRTLTETDLTVQLDDARTRKTLWRGIASTEVPTGQKPEPGDLDRSVSQLLDQYPPQK